MGRVLLAVFGLMTMIVYTVSFSERCDTNGTRYVCPLQYQQSSFSKCCGNGEVAIKCCENTADDSDNRLVMFVSLTVILSCFLISALMIVCCFWSRCPLFDLCWVNYSRKGVIAYTKEGEALNEPPDENEYAHQYSPVNVKISKVDDV